MSLSDPPEGRRANLTPALAVRVAIAGSVVLALFAIIFFRLWFLQVLTGDHYVLTAAQNQTRVVAIAPERGEILDSSGKALVTSTTALAAEIVPTELPVKVDQSNILNSYRLDDAVYDRLAHVIGVGTRRHHCTVAVPPPSCPVATGHCAHSTTRRLSPVACAVAQQIALNTYADVTIKSPVSTRVQFYIDERANQFKGVEVDQTSVSGYPYTTLAAQTLGDVGRLTTTEQKQKAFTNVNANAVVGQTGLEYEYDQFLRGTFGKQRVEVNASGVAIGEGRATQPTSGDELRTSLNLKVQEVGDAALQKSIDENGGQGGAFVMMNADTGAIAAMGSLPSYDPSVFTHPISPATYRSKFGVASNDPLFNRATQAQAPDGSTFKVITSVAAMQSGIWSPTDIYDDTGQFCPDGPAVPSACIHNAEHSVGGPLDLASAIKVSDDVFFYHLGDLLNVNVPDGGALQKWAKRFGIGQNPHIDIPNAANGLLPTPAFYDARERDEQECETATGSYRYSNGQDGISATKKKGYHRSPKHPVNPTTGLGGCGLATGSGSWTVGDNINAAVGQGDDEVSPLQLAMVYAAIENGGAIPRPHLGEDVESAQGTVLQKLSFPAQRHLDLNPTYLDTIRAGLHEAAQGGGSDPNAGTSQTVMQNFGLPIYGKTGTAEYVPTSGPEKGVEKDSAWYACYSTGEPGKAPMVAVVWVESGGFGAIGSAPVARELLHQYYFNAPGPYIAGISQDQ
jgi:penicillin-binding protein 2